jgi:uncharacterized protein YlxP (DUF503 family)
MSLGLLTLHIKIPGCNSLKEKRSRLKPIISRLHREFNISVAEIGHLDSWHETIIACALVSNNSAFTQNALKKIVEWIESAWPDLQIVNDKLELL